MLEVGQQLKAGRQLPTMTRAEEEFSAWLRSPQRIFVPRAAERYEQGRSLGLSRREVEAILAAEPELTRLRSGRIPKRQSAFRLRFWHEAELDLGFLNWNSVAHGTFFLGKPPPPLMPSPPPRGGAWHPPPCRGGAAAAAAAGGGA